MANIVDITGKTFGRLKVLSYAGKIIRSGDKYEPTWNCLCECGAEVQVRGRTLGSGHTKSCGCLKTETAFVANRKHGYFGTTEYRSWSSMIHRCTNPKAPNWDQYGGRGISVCDRWRSFSDFIADMGDKPTPDHSIDRIDVNGNYTPSNCRWASRSEQQRNKTNARLITIGSETKPLCDWAEISGIKSKTIDMRLSKGWPAEDAVFKPLRTLLKR